MKRWWRQLDPVLFGVTLALIGLGLLILISATRWSGATSEPSRQLLHVLVGALLMAGATALDYRVLGRFSAPLYLLAAALLMAVLIPGVGESAKGAQRWLSLGPLGAFQPSEMAKLVLIVVLARVLSAGRRGGVVSALALTGFMFVLIALQPDLGTAMVLAAVCLVMLFVAGASPIVLAGLITAGLAALPYVLKEYQRDRLLIFMNPELDPMGMGFSLVQSKTAIGSGGLWGKGYLQGPMTQNGFVPENWTDFIFSALGEEFGWVGAAGMLLLFALLFLVVLRIARRSPDLEGSLVTMGVLALLAFQLFVNIAMTTGLAPVVGIPLPFFSYGGSAMLLHMIGIGLVGSVSLRSRSRAPGADLATGDPEWDSAR
ncbi:MAG: rod shape-determining protein RodA [Armatimonadetes bacterium]|nr:rod shape-determining protein RodA [Armatimonadota bacterium]